MNIKSLQKGFTVWFTGLSGAGKTTLSKLVYHRVRESGLNRVEILDGDVIRTHLSKGLGFSKEDRDTNILRIGWVAHLLTKNGVPNLVAAISPYRDVRNEVRKMVETVGGEKSFIEVFVDAPLEVCETRDAKGLYKKARVGEILHFTGVDDPYEPPHRPEIHVRTDQKTPTECADIIINYLQRCNMLRPPRTRGTA